MDEIAALEKERDEITSQMLESFFRRRLRRSKTPAGGWWDFVRSSRECLPLDMVPFDVQLIGGMVLHQGRLLR